MKNPLPTTLILARCAAVVHAATIRVPADQPTIQAGLDSASRGDTVLVDSGAYVGTFEVRRALTLLTKYGPTCTSISGTIRIYTIRTTHWITLSLDSNSSEAIGPYVLFQLKLDGFGGKNLMVDAGSPRIYR